MNEVENLEQEEREETEEEREERLKREREEHKRKRRRRIVTGAVILLLLCMACSMIAIALNPEVTEGDATEIAESVGVVDETAEPTETPEPTATEEPTETPSPTPTPTLTPSPSPTVLVTLTSTLTPTVTSTPEPTPENTPVGQVSMSEYREFVSDSSGVLGENMGGMSEQMGMVGDNPSLIRDDDWITDTAYYFAVLDIQAEEIINYTDEHTPPAQAMEFHEGYVEVAELLRQAIDIYIEGIDEMDPSKISQGNDLLGQAGAIINTLPIEDIAP